MLACSVEVVDKCATVEAAMATKRKVLLLWFCAAVYLLPLTQAEVRSRSNVSQYLYTCVTFVLA